MTYQLSRDRSCRVNPHTTNELRFLAFRDVYFRAIRAALGVPTEDDVWDLFPDVGIHLTDAWYQATGQEGVED